MSDMFVPRLHLLLVITFTRFKKNHINYSTHLFTERPIVSSSFQGAGPAATVCKSLPRIGGPAPRPCSGSRTTHGKNRVFWPFFPPKNIFANFKLFSEFQPLYVNPLVIEAFPPFFKPNRLSQSALLQWNICKPLLVFSTRQPNRCLLKEVVRSWMVCQCSGL